MAVDERIGTSQLTSSQVAEYFLLRVDTDAGDCMTNLRLQKLVYYAQAWHLAIVGTSLFAEEIQAWVHGPVVPALYQHYRDCGWNPIPKPDRSLPAMGDKTEGILDEVWDAYGQFTAKYLENLTHAEDPWIDARKGYDPGVHCQEIISKDAMRTYYAGKLKSS